MIRERSDLEPQILETAKAMGQYMPGDFFVYRTDESREILYANEELCRIFGCGCADGCAHA